MKIINITASGQLQDLRVKNPRFVRVGTGGTDKLYAHGTQTLAVQFPTNGDAVQLFNEFNLNELDAVIVGTDVITITAD